MTPGENEHFPGFNVLDQADTWDETTRGVVLARLGAPPPIRFFDQDEERVCRALLARLLAQEKGPNIAVFETLDSRLAEDETDGWYYEDMPQDGEAWRLSLRHLDADAAARYGRGFDQLGLEEQYQVLEAVRTADRWHDLPGQRVWGLWIRYAISVFYAHPWAWNEIGFGGPAYPRGYKNLGLDRREPWEVRERDARDPVPWADRVESAHRRRRGQT